MKGGVVEMNHFAAAAARDDLAAAVNRCDMMRR